MLEIIPGEIFEKILGIFSIFFPIMFSRRILKETSGVFFGGIAEGNYDKLLKNLEKNGKISK